MTPTVGEGRDRAGHGARRAAVLAVLLSIAAPTVAAGADYMARRFDVEAVVTDAGGLEVTETVVFEFQSGTFQRVWRDIPVSRTDGIEIREARMDGVAFPRGEGPGRVEISGRNRVRVEWRFTPTGPSVHTFQLRYVARGVAYTQGDSDVVRWRLLPSEHRYRIAESRSVIRTRVPIAAAPAIESRRVGAATASRTADGIEILASEIRSNGWVIADVRLPARSIAASPPEWRQRDAYAWSLAPRWMTAAALVFAGGLLFLVMTRQAYPSPSISADATTTTSPPEPLPAALASVLAAKGGISGYQSAGTLLDLADRGVLRVRELPKSFGVRHYELAKVPGASALADHETEAIRIAFAGQNEAISFSKARARLARASRRFNAAVNTDLARRGLLHPDRQAIRRRLMIASIVFLIAGVLGCIASVPLISRFLGWPLVVPLALVLTGVIGLVMGAKTTPLSDQGLILASRWRGFRRHLKTLAEARETRGAPIDSRWIVYGIGLGLASQWGKFLKRHPSAAPAWFTAAAHDDRGAFAAFVGSQAASTGGHGGAGGGGGAAGGGGSGAG